MPEGKTPEIPTPRTPLKGPDSLRSVTIATARGESNSESSPRNLPDAIHTGPAIPTLESVVRGSPRAPEPVLAESEVIAPADRQLNTSLRSPNEVIEGMEALRAAGVLPASITPEVLREAVIEASKPVVTIDSKKELAGNLGGDNPNQEEIRRLLNDRRIILGERNIASIDDIDREALAAIDAQLRVAEARTTIDGAELLRRIENSTSPELEEVGRGMIEEVLDMRLSMNYDQRYEGDNGVRIRGLYDSTQLIVDGLSAIRNDRDPLTPNQTFVRSPEGEVSEQERLNAYAAVENFRARYILGGDEGEASPRTFAVEPLPTEAGRLVDARRAQYNEPSTSRTDREAARNDLLLYFRQAKNHGLLTEVDAVLNLIYQDLSRPGMSHEQAVEILDRGIARARYIATIEFQELADDDPNIPEQLTNVGQAYLDWAGRRLERSINRQSQREFREGEWVIPGQEQANDRRETYWELGSYPKFYVITARTPEQFLIAKETFLQMVRSGSIGKSPNVIFEHVKNFIEGFSGEGSRQIERGSISIDFLEANRVELEGLLYLDVGSYSKEVYNPKQSKEAAMAMAMDEGPARWLAVYRSGKGKTAAFTYMFDFEEEMNIFNNPVGEQGELNIVAGHFMQDVIRERKIERGIGLVLKDYDPRDPYLSSGDLGKKIEAAVDLDRIKAELARVEQEVSNGRIKLKDGETAVSRLSDRDQARLNAYRNNLARLGLTRSAEELKSLFECFEKGDTHIRNYQSYAEDQAKPENERQYPPLARLPESIRNSIDLGRIQVQLAASRAAVRAGTLRLERGQKAEDLLSTRDKKIYQVAYAESAAHFEVAFQMQGVLGEKARRGRGFLYSDRNPHLQYYFSVNEDLRTKWIDAEKTKVINTDTLLVCKEIKDANGHVIQESADEITPIIKNLSAAEKKSFKIGYMIYKISRDEKRLDSFPNDWQELYNNLPDKEKEDVVDNIPTYEVENWVSWGISWTKMEYANSPAKVRRQKVREARARLTKEIKLNGYSAQLISEDRVPGREPKLMRFKRPLGRTDPVTGEFVKYKNGEVLGYGSTGQEVRLSFDGEGNLAGSLQFDGEGRVIVFDSDGERLKCDITKDTRARLVTDPVVGETLVEEALPTFELAARGNDFRNRYTVDTYLFYQGNNRVTKFTPQVVAGRDRVAEGISRPEDEDVLATQALLVDLTRRRTRKLPDVQQQREVMLMASGVLESFQDRMRTRHAVYRTYMPKDGYGPRMRAGYRNEDWAGMDRLTYGYVEAAAQQPLRYARRMAARLADSPLEHDSGPARWGVHGVGGGIELMADHIKKISKQGAVGQFGLTKIFEVNDLAVEVYNALVGYTDPQTKKHVFGLDEKPTDNYEALHQYVEDLANTELLHKPKKAIPWLYKNRESYGRLRTVTQLMRTMYSDTDNSAGAVPLEDHEVFLPDGSFNTAIETDNKIKGRNGIARNRQYAFLYGEDGWDEGTEGYYGWLQDESPGGGSDVYRREKFWASLMNEDFHVFTGNVSNVGGVLVPETVSGGKVKNWETDKDI